MLSGNPLRRPFPDRYFNRAHIYGLVRISLFVFLFLYLFRTADIHSGQNYLLVCLGYGMVTLLISLAYSYLTLRVLRWKKNGPGWTLGHWIGDCALLLACIAIGNFVYYNALVGWTAFHPYVLLAICVPTVLVGLFPIAFSGMAIQLRAEREHQRTAARLLLRGLPGQLPDRDRSIEIRPGSQLSVGSILFAESRQNYVRFVLLRAGHPEEEIVRLTLSELERRLTGTAIVRCHRSYLVNLDRVQRADGNAQGLKLRLAGTDETVPVSRSYVGTLRSRLDIRP